MPPIDHGDYHAYTSTAPKSSENSDSGSDSGYSFSHNVPAGKHSGNQTPPKQAGCSTSTYVWIIILLVYILIKSINS